MRILLVEDEESIRNLVKLNLELEGYEVSTANDGKKALQKFQEEHFDMLILDVMLPEVDGFSIAEKVRLTHLDIPIMMLTAKDGQQDRITGLRRGADDYLTKPFNLEELLLRVQKLLQRAVKTPENTPEHYTFGDNNINFVTFEVSNETNGTFSLTKKEAMLLKLLVDRKNEVVSRQQILQSVWGYDVFPSTRTIDNFILSFRKYFEKDPANPIHFLSIRGIGYKFIEK
jgi:two-component system, OmpR family, alkaline phosphatase synthesis response regulator PhoP